MAIYTVSQITTYLRESLESNPFLNDIWITGEVSNLSRSSAGHSYFTTKDDQNQLRCVMFGTQRGGEMLQDNKQVTLHGRISLYPTRGALQFYVDLVQTEGLGLLNIELEQLKSRLKMEGLFEHSRKRSLPYFPKRIGVVTSPTGAVFKDICNVLKRRYPIAEIVLAPTLVQGSEAPRSIVFALEKLNGLNSIDVVIIARGGGAVEELSAFNEEIVVRAIYASQAPVVSGVGHETNTTLSDLVADVRAPTPSAAAELVAPDTKRLLVQVIDYIKTSSFAMKTHLGHNQQDVQSTVQRLSQSFPKLGFFQQRTDDLIHGLENGIFTQLKISQERLNGFTQNLNALNPKAVLGRGYAVVHRSDNDTLVNELKIVKKDDSVKITVCDGTFKATVI